MLLRSMMQVKKSSFWLTLILLLAPAIITMTARAKAALSITIIRVVIIIINIIVMVFPEKALNSGHRDKGKLVASSGSHNGTGPGSVCVYSLPMYVREKKRER